MKKLFNLLINFNLQIKKAQATDLIYFTLSALIKSMKSQSINRRYLQITKNYFELG